MLVIDNFAGGGGASTGIEAALGRPVDIAVNHDPEAIAIHQANHPLTRHFCENIWEVDPHEACSGRPVSLAWFSPDCTHFSRAKGAVPRKQDIRGLAWVVLRWAKAVRPAVILLENVEEFQGWGPLLEDGRPDPGAAGQTFRAWVAELTALGYRVEWRSLVAADYGTPTIRKRLYLIARCDGQPISWPRVSHPRPAWRPASEVIDFSLPCPSIFDRARPLAEATLRRIAEGIRRFVLAGSPYLIPGNPPVAPALIQAGYGERAGQAPRALNLAKPLGTVVAQGNKFGLVAAFLAKHFGGGANGKAPPGQELRKPTGTVTAKDHHALVQAFLVKYYGSGGQGQQLDLPLHTATSKARFGLVMVHGQPYQITDIGMRMLSPRELYLAQGFPPGYVIDPILNGKKLSKTAQIKCAGNSVCPPVAAQLVRANAARLAEAV